MDLNYNVANVLAFKLGRPQDAIAYYERELEGWPTNPKIHNNLGIAFYQSGRAPRRCGTTRSHCASTTTTPTRTRTWASSTSMPAISTPPSGTIARRLRLNPNFDPAVRGFSACAN